MVPSIIAERCHHTTCASPPHSPPLVLPPKLLRRHIVLTCSPRQERQAGAPSPTAGQQHIRLIKHASLPGGGGALCVCWVGVGAGRSGWHDWQYLALVLAGGKEIGNCDSICSEVAAPKKALQGLGAAAGCCQSAERRLNAPMAHLLRKTGPVKE